MVIEIAGLICLFASIAVVLSNPKRRTNWIVAGLFLIIAIFNGTIGAEFFEIPFLSFGSNGPYYPWRRANAAILAFCPLLIFMLHASIVNDARSKPIRYFPTLPWLAVSALPLFLCLTKSFIFLDPVFGYVVRGKSYFISALISIIIYSVLSIRCYNSALRLTGIAAIEMRLVAFSFTLACLFTISMTGVGNLLQVQSMRRLIFTVFPLAIIISTWAMTTSKLYDFREILVLLCQRLTLVFLLTLAALGIWHYYETKIVSPVDIILVIGICGGVAFWLDRKSRDWFDIDGERLLAQTRRSTIELAQRETEPEKIVSEFEGFLADRFQAEFATLLFEKDGAYSAKDLSLRKHDPSYLALCQMGWSTPESLFRKRSRSAIFQLRQFVERHAIGLIIKSPKEGRSPSVLVVLGRKKASWPFTYPEVRRIQDIAELMDNIITRARLTTQAALTARMEHLAMMSRGLAHDLKNLITPVSSFLIHTDEHFPPDSPEAEVHSAARRSVRIMTDYVREALFFSERLSPNSQPVDLAKLFQTVAEITASRATRRGITVSFTGEYPPSLVADTVLLQRLLGNLVSNAIDASQPGTTVTVSVSQPSSTKVRFQVKDEGSGIAPENLSRIFDPYFTTKEFGEDVRGFGLGLTICQKIAELHGGTISVESQVGRGTIISVDLPRAPASPNRDAPLLDEEPASHPSTLSR
jgi:signal transduction histidine kinase